ncbi:MAG TPA: AbrB/MazE/SpoVT family DNA-binding domain-containing protein [Anaerolineae bacterium]|nr:AbrB/MazE/SpoVT family DNA-binding domain-containing protein [Anaerolineae bacterium]
MKTVTVSAKGAIVIPKEIREAGGLHPGTRVALITYAGRVHIVPVPDDPIESGYGFLHDYTPLYSGPSVREELIEEHRSEVEQEQSRLAEEEHSHEAVRA